MAPDMKKTIAEAARKLLIDKNVKKLTVKDIVAECQITRQTFYYHFEDIPALIQWVIKQSIPQLLDEAFALKDPEKALRYFFLFALNSSAYVKKGIQTNYGDEIERLLEQFVYELLEQICEREHLYKSLGRSELKLVLRYHSQAILGFMKHWSDEDTRNLDMIVHQLYLLISGKISPFS